MSRVRITPLVTALLAGAATALPAQQPPATLSLEEAVNLARRYSPGYRAQQNDEGVAEWAVRAAYGNLLPSLTVRSGVDWQAGGTPRFGNFSAEDVGLTRTPDYLFSDYSVSLALQFSGSTFFRMAQERAAREATRARIEAASYTLDSDVTRAYLVALRARDGVALANRELATAQEALRLAQGRFEAGAATRLDVAQAEVENGRAEVALLQAQSAEEAEKLRLLQRIGVELDRDVELTTQLRVFEPQWSVAELTEFALRQHPQLQAARAAEASGRAAARSARMTYLPSIAVGGGWSGYTRSTRDESYLLGQAEQSAQGRMEDCQFWNRISAGLAQPLSERPQDCSRFTVTDETRARVLAANDVWPFNFTKTPPSFGLTVSWPVLNGFTREYQVQQARAAAEDAKHLRREEELNRRALVATAFLALRTAYLSVAIEERNVAAAAEQLELARERYRLGAGSILELTQAQATRARADQAQLAALYAFHENLVALETAVGRPLR
jgi:outer membrane protein